MRTRDQIKNLALGANAVAVEIQYSISAPNFYPVPIHSVGTLHVAQKDVGSDGIRRYSQDMIGFEQTFPVVAKDIEI